MAPVSREARAGEQTGLVQKKRSKRVPLRASRSRFGVRISRLPAQQRAQGAWSSVSMNTMFGLLLSLLATLSPFPQKIPHPHSAGHAAGTQPMLRGKHQAASVHQLFIGLRGPKDSRAYRIYLPDEFNPDEPWATKPW